MATNRDFLPANLSPAEVKDKLLSEEDQRKAGKRADGTAEPRYLYEAIPVAPRDQEKVIAGKADAGSINDGKGGETKLKADAGS